MIFTPVRFALNFVLSGDNTVEFREKEYCYYPTDEPTTTSRKGSRTILSLKNYDYGVDFPTNPPIADFAKTARNTISPQRKNILEIARRTLGGLLAQKR
jgi:hypothetical protein